MPTPEYLNLIADVQDLFTDDLLRLSGLLEEVGLLAEAIDPIRIDVEVNDGELQTLMANMGAVGAMDSLSGGSVASTATARSGVNPMSMVRGTTGPTASGGGGGGAPEILPDGGLRRLVDTISDLDVGMTDFYDLLAAMLPLLLNFVAAMPAAIGGLLGLATAAAGAAAGLAGIAGLGLLGAASMEAGGGMPAMEDFTSVLEDIRDMFWESFAPLAEDLAPMFESALGGLDRFFSELTNRAGALLAFRDDAEAFGNFMIDFFAVGLAKLVRFADAMGPIFSMIGNFLSSTDIVGAFSEITREALPGLVILGREIMDLMPAILELSSGFLIVSGAILSFLDEIGNLIGYLPISGRLLGALVGVFLTLTTVMLLSAKVMSIWSGTAVANAISSMWGMITAVATGEKTLHSYTTAAYQSASATLTLANAFRALAAATGVGLVLSGVSMLVEEFGGLDSNISDATDSLKDFEKTSNRMEGSGMGSGLDSNAYIDYTENSMTVNQNGGSSNGDVEDTMAMYNYFS